MAYDEQLAERVRRVIGVMPGLTEKKMFGGIGYLLNGNMACGVNKEYLIVRVGPENYEVSLEKENTKVFDMTGRPMTGWIMVAPDGLQDIADLKGWVDKGLIFAGTLPKK